MARRPRQLRSTPLRAVHTPNFPALLRRLGASLLVTTYQAGKLVMVRDEGDHLNTHFRSFPGADGSGSSRRPPGHRHVGAGLGIRRRPGRHGQARADRPRTTPASCPRSCHVTGNIQGHEMAWGNGEELWVVNTRFSCLCTLDRSASFTPRWRPPFVTALEPTDRCHLNGLAMVDGRTALRHGAGRHRLRRGLAGQ